MGESRVVIPIFGILDVTGEVIGMWVILAAVTVISLLATRHMRERPGKFQNVIETGVEYLDNYFAGILGKKESRKHLLFLGSLFIFIIFGNYTGLIPGAGLTDYWKAPTSSLSVTLGLSIITFFYLQGSSIHARGFLGYLKRFISPIAIMLPLLLLDEATSALDVTTERKVLRNIVQQRPNKTCIVTTHRPSVLSLCQRVYRVVDTRVTELSEEESAKMAMDF